MTKPDEKPSELLIRCLDDFGESEATTAIVLYRDESGNLNWRASDGGSKSEIVGMLELAKQAILHDFLTGGPNDER